MRRNTIRLALERNTALFMQGSAGGSDRRRIRKIFKRRGLSRC